MQVFRLAFILYYLKLSDDSGSWKPWWIIYKPPWISSNSPTPSQGTPSDTSFTLVTEWCNLVTQVTPHWLKAHPGDSMMHPNDPSDPSSSPMTESYTPVTGGAHCRLSDPRRGSEERRLLKMSKGPAYPGTKQVSGTRTTIWNIFQIGVWGYETFSAL